MDDYRNYFCISFGEVSGWQAMDGHRNYFRICASGKQFNVDAFAKTTRLQFERFEHEGHQGITIELGCGAELDMKEQQSIAVTFLTANRADLEELRANNAVTQFYLGLEETVYDPSLGSIFDLSPSLMRIALEIGIHLTVWSCLRKNPWSNSSSPAPKRRWFRWSLNGLIWLVTICAVSVGIYCAPGSRERPLAMAFAVLAALGAIGAVRYFRPTY
jgi:hypothetical protein